MVYIGADPVYCGGDHLSVIQLSAVLRTINLSLTCLCINQLDISSNYRQVVCQEGVSTNCISSFGERSPYSEVI